jgi:hypothetical protein
MSIEKKSNQALVASAGVLSLGQFFPDFNDVTSPVGLVLTILSLVLKFYSAQHEKHED